MFLKQSEMSRCIPSIKNYLNERNLSKLRKLKVRSKFAEYKLDSTFNQISELQQKNKQKEDQIDNSNMSSQQNISIHNNMLSGKLLRKLSNNFKESQRNNYILTSQGKEYITQVEKKKNDFLSDYEDKIDELFNIGTQQIVQDNLPTCVTSKLIKKKIEQQSKSKNTFELDLQIKVKDTLEQKQPEIQNFFSPQAQQYQLKIPKYHQLQLKSFQHHQNSINVQLSTTDRINNIQDKKIIQILQQHQGKIPHKPYFY